MEGAQIMDLQAIFDSINGTIQAVGATASNYYATQAQVQQSQAKAQIAAQPQGNFSGGAGGMDTMTMMMIGGALLLAVVVMKKS